MRGLAALALTALFGCAPPEPLHLGAQALRWMESETMGHTASIELRFENRGEAAVHVYPQLIVARSAEGGGGSVREFLERVRTRQMREPSPESRQAVLAGFRAIGVDAATIRSLAESQIEVPPRSALTRVFPLSFAQHTRALRVEVAYHDDALDRIFRARAEVTER